jgi:drug/metabolite transporter (DMT)-like permease
MKYRLLLLLAALIWGTAFVAQRISTETMGPFGYNGIRFALGSLSLLPLIAWQGRSVRTNLKKAPPHLTLLTACLFLGFALFAGASLQQVGIIYTTVAKAGFITALYIVAVPIFGLFLHNPLRLSHISGCIVAIIGLYLLSVHGDMESLNYGDILELLGVIFWTMHILLVSRFVQYYPGIWLASGQFAACAFFNLLAVFISSEPLSWSIIMMTIIPILYGGLLSSGVAYTLQIVGQSRVAPTEASLLLSFEMIFSAISAYIILGETLTMREILGCALMACGIFSAQIPSRIIWQGFRRHLENHP